MNYLRTAILLAGLTALFMAFGYLIGGGTGMMIALVIAAATNLFSYWNSDKLVLSMHQAREVDEQSAPEFVGIVRELAQRADLPMPRVYLMDSAQPNALTQGGIRNTPPSARRLGSLTRSTVTKSPALSVTNSATSAITTR